MERKLNKSFLLAAYTLRAAVARRCPDCTLRADRLFTAIAAQHCFSFRVDITGQGFGFGHRFRNYNWMALVIQDGLPREFGKVGFCSRKRFRLR